MPTLEAANLSAAERLGLDRFIELLRAELGPELIAVWLYGSRARGERHHEDSDVDLLVITARGRDDGARVMDVLEEACGEDVRTWLDRPARRALSPRSEELRALATRKLAAARTLLDSGFSQDAAGAAYYAMLYAARAALSEGDEHAKTHSGTWTLFSERYVNAGRFDRGSCQERARRRAVAAAGRLLGRRREPG